MEKVLEIMLKNQTLPHSPFGMSAVEKYMRLIIKKRFVSKDLQTKIISYKRKAETPEIAISAYL